jgi:hypothetical protein
MFLMRHVVRGSFAELNRPVPRRRPLVFVALAGIVAFGSSSGIAESARAAAGSAQRTPALAPHTPATPVHTEFVVEVNRKGQVTRVKSGKSCPDLSFNAMTYGNALQAFIRTADGRAISGVYRLAYDYDPKTKRVKRTVALLHAGGVDPDKLGAVDEMAIVNARHHGPAPSPTPDLPDFKAITGHRH